jgi:hypothetical protein
MTTLLSCALTVACALHGHRLDFSALAQADYIEVRSNLDAPIKTIDDSNQVRAATQFIEQYRGGWKDPLHGPRVPKYMLIFYRGQERLGGFGISDRYLVSYPPTQGFWSRDVSPDAVVGLLRALGLNAAGVKQ